jgi:hypothetical protein
MAQAVGLPARSLNQCITMAKQGLCFMCGGPNHEQGPFHCPRVTANAGYRAALNAFYGQRKTIREDMRKLGMDAALAKHHLPRRWTLAPMAAALIGPPLDPNAAGPSHANAEGAGPMDA